MISKREFMSQVTSWLNEFLKEGSYPFEKRKKKERGTGNIITLSYFSIVDPST